VSYSDYLAGVRDGFAIGFNAGFRKGVEVGSSTAYLKGYGDGFSDATKGLPYKPRERLVDFQSLVPDIKPLKIDPLPAYTPAKLPEIEPIKPLRLSTRDDCGFRSRDAWRMDDFASRNRV